MLVKLFHLSVPEIFTSSVFLLKINFWHKTNVDGKKKKVSPFRDSLFPKRTSCLSKINTNL